MTNLLERAINTARELPPEMQDDIGRLVLSFLGEGQPVELTADDIAAVHASREAAARGEFATDEEMQAIWAKYDHAPAS